MLMSTPLCPRCPHARPPVLSTGPSPCRLLLIAESPTQDDDRYSEPCVGYNGRELNYVYLPMLGIPRSEIHIAHSILCSKVDYDYPTNEDAYTCASVHLGALLARVRPQVIAPMGAVACSLFPGIDLNMHHGIPREGAWGAVWRGVVWPMYSPGAGMKQTGYMIPLMRDFYELGKLLKGMPES